MPVDRGSTPAGGITASAVEASWDIKPIEPTLNIVANYTGGAVAVVAYIRLRIEDDEGELNPVWIAAVLDEATGRIYSPTEDGNFIGFEVLLDPREWTEIVIP